MSQPLTINIPHQLGKDEARRRLETGFVKIEQQFAKQAQVDKTWDGDRMAFRAVAMGQTITGTLDVLEEAIRLEIVLPGFLGMLASKIRGKVEKESQLLLENKKK
ncbi:polyhydroxyalkanoic acid system protein [Caulobacter sp. SLTY]|uniref:polyhydroxyalkanoic acid system family protein n=1 Tax=Caulobacter sp. SLTY TaxID=2683262 RepID=UPI001411ED32|nr:polyhydroxyalkanoic acid system family protein [Caulobacter sp. SLTY]NBB16223.1 polyhydroxyalkanoic acid system protein [Caulobacter sp. SLTY]